MDLLGGLDVVGAVAQGADARFLTGARGVATTRIAGTTYVYVAGTGADGIQILSLDESGALTILGATAETDANGLDSPRDLVVVERGDDRYLVAVSTGSSAISAFRIFADGGLQVTARVAATDLDPQVAALERPVKLIAIAKADKTYLVSADFIGDALASWTLTGSGRLVIADTVNRTDEAHLDGVEHLAHLRVAGRDYVIAASASQAGLGVYRLDGQGQLHAVAEKSLASRAISLAVLPRDDGAVIAVARADRKVALYTLDGEALVRLSTTALAGDGQSHLQALTAFTVGEAAFLAGLSFDDRLSIFALEGTAIRLVSTTPVDANFDGPGDIAMVQIGGSLFALSTTPVRSRIAVTEIGGGADQIAGSDARDVLVGLAGRDALSGGDGADGLSGGAGADTLEGGAGPDTLSGGAGDDWLAGGGGRDALDGGGGFDVATYAASSGGVQVDLTVGSGQGAHAAGDSLTGIEALDGSDHGDRLSGDGGANTLQGRAGADRLLGRGGPDQLEGGQGADTLFGHGAGDALDGGVGDDRLKGGAGPDVLRGGDGRDALSGQAGADDLRGGAGRDTLTGGAGDDRLTGGGSSDQFVFEDGAGSDVVTDFAPGIDWLDLSAIASIATWSQLTQAATERAGDLVIDLGAGSLRLAGIDLAELGSGDILFG